MKGPTLGFQARLKAATLDEYLLYRTAYCVESILLLLPGVLNSRVQKTSCFVFLEVHPAKAQLHTEMHIKGPLLAPICMSPSPRMSEACFTAPSFFYTGTRMVLSSLPSSVLELFCFSDWTDIT